MIEHVFDHRVAARQGIAHDDSFGIGSQMRRLVPRLEANAEGLQLIAHRRIDVGITAIHLVPELTRKRGDAAHEGAADSQDVKFHPASLACCIC